MPPFYVLLLPALFGSLIMGWVCGLMGFICYLQGNSLLAEVLAHTSYPAILAVLLLFSKMDFPCLDKFSWLRQLVFHGTVLLSSTALLEGFRRIYGKKIHNDALFCWSLSTAMGLSMLLLSIIQTTHAHLLPFAKTFLYGQTILIDWEEVSCLAVVGSLLTLVFVVGKNVLKMFLFDPEYLLLSSSSKRIIYGIVSLASTLAVLLGLQISGVLVITALMVAPAISAKIMVSSFFPMALLSGFLGLVSAGLGVLLSFFLEMYIQMYVPPGPTIVFVASFIAAFVHVFAFPGGWLAKRMKRRRYQERSMLEDVLKFIAKCSEEEVSVQELADLEQQRYVLQKCLRKLMKTGFLANGKKRNSYSLTTKGREIASALIRLHRLWEVYLVRHGGVSVDHVHVYAEEMEHTLTLKSIETLEKLLNNPKQDPHGKIIPRNIQDNV